MIVIKNIQDLSKMLRCEKEYIETIACKPYDVRENVSNLSESDIRSIPNLIKTYTVKKKNKPKELRHIYYPLSGQLKSTFKTLTSWLNTIYTPSKSVHGFIAKRSIKSNAAQHLACNYLLNLDIKNFFESITKDKIITSLTNYGLTEEVSEIIANLTTLNEVLVQGFSTSPVISNLVATEMDEKLLKYADNTNCTYTRYADDITFSSNDKILGYENITDLIMSFGFPINYDKTRRRKRGQKQTVTGLTIFDSTKPRIPKKIKRNLRLEAHYIKKYGLKNHCIRRLVRKGKFNNNPNIDKELKLEIDTTRERIQGWINFSQGIESEFSSKLNDVFNGRRQ